MVQEPAKLSPKVVGQEFVRQYYTMLAKEPRYLHRFYGSHSEMMHGGKEENQPAVGQVKIREKIKSLDFKDVYAKVAQLDAFMTIGSGICIQVAGEISNNQEPLRRFMQTFVLGPQDHDGKAPGTSFYVHNDIFRYQDDIFVDEQQSSLEPASGDAPIEVDSFQEEQIIVDSTTIAAIPEPEIVQPTPDPIPEPIEPEPVVEETTPEAPEPVVEVIPEPVEEVEPVKEIVEVVEAEQEPVEVVKEEIKEVVEQIEAVEIKETRAPTPPQPAKATPAPRPTPMSWAARVGGTNRVGPAGAFPGQAAPAPILPTPTPKVEQNGTVEPEFPPVTQNGNSVPSSTQSANNTTTTSAPPQRQQHNDYQRENGQKERYNRDYNNDRPRREYNDDKQQIFVGGLPYDISEQSLREVFSQFGQVKHVRITNRGNSHGGSNSAGFGFVTFQKESEARKALESKEGIYYNNLQLNVEEKKTRGDRDRPPRNDNFRQQNGNYKQRDGQRRGGGGDYNQRDNQGQGQRQQGRQSYGQDGRRGDRGGRKY